MDMNECILRCVDQYLDAFVEVTNDQVFPTVLDNFSPEEIRLDGSEIELDESSPMGLEELIELAVGTESESDSAASPACSESTEEEDASSIASSDSAISHSDNHRKASKVHKAQSASLSKEALQAAVKARAALGDLPSARRAFYDAKLTLPRVREALGFPYVQCASASTTLLTPSNFDQLSQMAPDQRELFWKGCYKLWHERDLSNTRIRNRVLKKDLGFSKDQVTSLVKLVKNYRNGTSCKKRAFHDLQLILSALHSRQW